MIWHWIQVPQPDMPLLRTHHLSLIMFLMTHGRYLNAAAIFTTPALVLSRTLLLPRPHYCWFLSQTPCPGVFVTWLQPLQSPMIPG
jgi:hypothetical protein